MQPGLPTPIDSVLRSTLDRWAAASPAADGSTPLIAGVLSGTSADGIDVVLARPRLGRSTDPGAPPRQALRGLEARAFATVPYEPDLGARVRAVLGGKALTLAEVAALDRDLGLAFGAAARNVAERHRLGSLALVASHGQTVFHHDGREDLGKITLQLGDGDFVAEAAGAPVVSDFRVRDCAAGGEGAPLVGLVDEVLFEGAPRPLAILNLGGIANWTLLTGVEDLGDPRPALAFDTGPAGALLDGLSRRRLGEPYDRAGAVASAGQVAAEWLDRWLSNPEVQALGAAAAGGRRPRSTGLDTFNADWVDGIEASELPTEDLLATACALVAELAARGLAGSLAGRSSAMPVPQSLHVVVAGGGVHNDALMGELRQRTASALVSVGSSQAGFGPSDAAGVPPDAREALAFAALGARFLLGEPSTSEPTTGALGGRILGKWSPGAVR